MTSSIPAALSRRNVRSRNGMFITGIVGFGVRVVKRPKPRTLPTHQDDGLQKDSLWNCRVAMIPANAALLHLPWCQTVGTT